MRTTKNKTGTGEIHVAIVDKHPVTVAGAEHICRKAGFIIDLVAYSGRQFIEGLKADMCPIVIMDIEMNDMDGVQTTEWLAIHRKEIKVIAHTAFTDRPHTEPMLRAGVCGLIFKVNTTDHLIKAIKDVHHHGFHYNDDYKKGIKLLHETSPNNKIKIPTPRDQQFIDLLPAGDPDKIMAEKMNISTNTLQNHKQKLFGITNTKNKSQLMFESLQRGWLRLCGNTPA